MDAASALGGTEKIPAVQSGGNVYFTPTQMKTFIYANSANIHSYVANYAALPLGTGSTDPEVGDLVGVNASTGTWLLGTLRNKGFYKRIALTGVVGDDYGTSPFAGYPATTEIGAEPAWTETLVTLASAGWAASAQSETVTGLTASSEVMVFPPSDRTVFLAYGAAQISATAIGTDSITFTCTTDPTIDISNVIVRWR